MKGDPWEAATLRPNSFRKLETSLRAMVASAKKTV
jgi:hypothetical protein